MLLLLLPLPLLLAVPLQHLLLLADAQPTVPVLVVLGRHLNAHTHPGHRKRYRCQNSGACEDLCAYLPVVPGVAVVAADHRATVVLFSAGRANPYLVTVRVLQKLRGL